MGLCRFVSVDLFLPILVSVCDSVPTVSGSSVWGRWKSGRMGWGGDNRYIFATGHCRRLCLGTSPPLDDFPPSSTPHRYPDPQDPPGDFPSSRRSSLELHRTHGEGPPVLPLSSSSLREPYGRIRPRRVTDAISHHHPATFLAHLSQPLPALLPPYPWTSCPSSGSQDLSHLGT